MTEKEYRIFWIAIGAIFATVAIAMIFKLHQISECICS